VTPTRGARCGSSQPPSRRTLDVKMLGTMPAVAIKLRKLSGDETASVFPRRGQMDLSEYLQALSALQPGDVGAMELGDLTSRAAKRRIGLSAAQLGFVCVGPVRSTAIRCTSKCWVHRNVYGAWPALPGHARHGARHLDGA